MKQIYVLVITILAAGCGKSDSTPPSVTTTENFDLKQAVISDQGNVTFVPVVGSSSSLLKVTNGLIDLNKSGTASTFIKVIGVSADKQIFEMQYVPDATFQTINGSATKNYKSNTSTSILYVSNFPLDTNTAKSNAMNLLNALPGSKKYNPN